MKENIIFAVAFGFLLVGIFLIACLPYAEIIQIWNVRAGSLIGVAMIVSSITIMGILSEKRK